MSLEVVKTIAMLCAIAAGDHNEMSSVVSQIENSQVRCHRHYASCYKKEMDWIDCIKSRKSQGEEFAESLKNKNR